MKRIHNLLPQCKRLLLWRLSPLLGPRPRPPPRHDRPPPQHIFFRPLTSRPHHEPFHRPPRPYPQPQETRNLDAQRKTRRSARQRDQNVRKPERRQSRPDHHTRRRGVMSRQFHIAKRGMGEVFLGYVV